ncbi:MAG: YeeE/YedE thiosulfate transporter family protein [Alphaproteobacteria bacterium]
MGELPVITASLVLAAVFGFAAHRASICTVKAVLEVLTTRRAYMLLSFAKIVLWVAAITAVLVWLAPLPGAGPAQVWALSPAALIGGFVFGVGAALNGGCAFYTLSRLGDGHLRMAVSILGFLLGALVLDNLGPESGFGTREPMISALGQPRLWSIVLVGLVGVWMAWETGRLFTAAGTGSGLRARILANRYRLSTAAALLGLSGGALFALNGPWAYTSTLARGAAHLAGTGPGPTGPLWGIVAAMLVGMGLSAWQRGTFSPDWRPSRKWLLNFAGGSLMGLGAAAAPGGNDVLILHEIPGLSPHALPAYLALLLGIGVTLMAFRSAGLEYYRVDCSGDLCSS